MNSAIKDGLLKGKVAFVAGASGGINMLTQCLAMELGPARVRVNAIAPGPIAGTEGVARLAPTPQDEVAIVSSIPLRAYGEKIDIAEAVIYLSSDSGRYITGTILNVDGGAELGDASGNAIPPAFAS
jgi:NAD(P)-dependent dehydrogenase (short-subunit alcohol dehydrogenase family)